MNLHRTTIKNRRGTRKAAFAPGDHCLAVQHLL